MIDWIQCRDYCTAYAAVSPIPNASELVHTFSFADILDFLDLDTMDMECLRYNMNSQYAHSYGYDCLHWAGGKFLLKLPLPWLAYRLWSG